MKLYKAGETAVYEGYGLYSYKTYIGEHNILLEKGDSCWVVGDYTVAVYSGPCEIESATVATVIRGYAPGMKASSINGTQTNLPYINGCSSDELIKPVRPGDPTLQKLLIPPHCSEQAHHIHPTGRVVFVQEGEGWSVVGMQDEEVKLEVGDVVILDINEPHHFYTKDSHLLVLPLHVYSSTVLEHNHSMKVGTFEV